MTGYVLMVPTKIRRGLLLAIAVGLLPQLVACSRQDPPSPYQVFSGTVKALDTETGELFIRPKRAPHPWRFDRNVPCVVTKDSEIYMNDRFSRLDEIVVGDLIESVGYRDHDRFVLSLVSVTRIQPEPPLPELSPPTTAPAANTLKE